MNNELQLRVFGQKLKELVDLTWDQEDDSVNTELDAEIRMIKNFSPGLIRWLGIFIKSYGNGPCLINFFSSCRISFFDTGMRRMIKYSVIR